MAFSHHALPPLTICKQIPLAGSHLNVLQLVFQIAPFCLQQIGPVERFLQSLSQTEDVTLLQVHLLL